MTDDFPCEEQQSGWSCLPFAVRSVLAHYEMDFPLESVYRWCRAGQDGIPGACRWPDATNGLLARFPDSDVVNDGDWEAVQSSLVVDSEPVIVTISDPTAPEFRADHAIVLLGFAEGSGKTLVFCDPETGKVEEMPVSTFLPWWETPGGRGIILRP
jgi:hypothetical protein